MTPRGPRHRDRHAARRATRCRSWLTDAGRWDIHARIERFIEPALLLSLRDGERHGYDLAAQLEEAAPDDRVDLGNLYRLLRSLEEEGLVTSQWRDDLPGKAKRTYALTEAGGDLLDAWVTSLQRANETVATFLRRYHQGEPA